MELKDIDLNLLLVFNKLLAERRVSKVAEGLGMTQSGVSNALKRLRLLLGDELFVRTARGMEPTPCALRLAEPIGYALGTIHDALNETTHFDPRSSKQRFIIGMTAISLGRKYISPMSVMPMMKRCLLLRGSKCVVSLSASWIVPSA